MKNIKHEVLRLIEVALPIVVWVGVLQATHTPLGLNIEAVKKIPDVVTICVILAWVFKHWMWKWRIFQGWLVPYPNLEGTWRGTVASNWVNPETGQQIAPLTVTMVIKQSFSKVSCTVYTAESKSYSTSATITQYEDSEQLFLDFNYTNRSKAVIRDRSPIHDGASRLKIITKPYLQLEGEYWTSRCTRGDMELKYVSEELDQKFEQ